MLITKDLELPELLEDDNVVTLSLAFDGASKACKSGADDDDFDTS